MTIKVCHIISGDLWAGAEKVAWHLLSGLHRSGKVDLSAIILNPGRLACEIDRLGIPLYVLDENNHGFFSLLGKVCRSMRRDAPQIVHSHRYKENLLGYLAARRHCRLVRTQHGISNSFGTDFRPKGILSAKLNSGILGHRFDRTVAVSREMTAILAREWGVPPTKLLVIRNGVEIPASQRSSSGTRPFTIGSAGRLFPVKNFPLLVEIAEEVVRREPGIRFLLAGEGPERPTIENRLRMKGLASHFELVGHLSDMSEFYHGLDLYICTSRHEGLPMTILEAMSHGLPIIASSVGGIPEVVEESVQGHLVDRADPKVYAARILDLYRFPRRLAEMSLAARERVEKEFTVERMVSEYINLYEELTKP